MISTSKPGTIIIVIKKHTFVEDMFFSFWEVTIYLFRNKLIKVEGPILTKVLDLSNSLETRQMCGSDSSHN